MFAVSINCYIPLRQNRGQSIWTRKSYRLEEGLAYVAQRRFRLVHSFMSLKKPQATPHSSISPGPLMGIVGARPRASFPVIIT